MPCAPHTPVNRKVGLSVKVSPSKKREPSYLYLVGNIYYYRRRLPKDLQVVLGKHEIRINLHEPYITKARKLAQLLNAQTYLLMETVRMAQKNTPKPPVSATPVGFHTDLPPLDSIISSFQLEKIKEKMVELAEFPKVYTGAIAQEKAVYLSRTDVQGEADKLYSLMRWKAEKDARFAENFFAKLDTPNKIPISFETLHKRMAGFLRHLLLSDSAAVYSHKIIHADALYVNGTEIVPEDAEVNHALYLAKYEAFYAQLIDEPDRIHEHLAYFDAFLFTHPIVQENEICRENYVQIFNELCKTMVSFYRILQARLIGDYLTERVVFGQDYISYPLVAETAEQIEPTVSAPLIMLQKTPPASKKTTVADFISMYAEKKVQDEDWQVHSKSDHVIRLMYLDFLLPGKNIEDVTRDDMRMVRDTMRKLPPNWKKRYKNKPIEEVLAIKHDATLSPKTINIILEAISSMFAWGMREGYITDNPAKALGVKDKRSAKELRNSFTPEELKRIFTNTEFLGYKKSKPSRFWLPYIALYTGMRLEEICQLYCTDIKQVPGEKIFYFDINENEENGIKDKHTKSTYASRTVPIHPRLIELGFLEYLGDVRKAGHDRVFPDISKTPSKGKYGHAISAYFSRLVQTVGCREKTSFHSLRHNFAEFFEKIDKQNNMFRQVFGHTAGDLAGKQYGSKFTPEECYHGLITLLKFDV